MSKFFNILTWLLGLSAAFCFGVGIYLCLTITDWFNVKDIHTLMVYYLITIVFTILTCVSNIISIEYRKD